MGVAVIISVEVEVAWENACGYMCKEKVMEDSIRGGSG